MEPAEQVKTIMQIFGDLDHENQVSLFKEIKGALLSIRSGLIEKHQKDQEYAAHTIDRLRAGNEEIHGGLGTQVAKQGY